MQDEIRGKVTIVGLSDARIPWPLGLKGKARAYIVYGDLARIVRRESAQAVMYWWGVSRPWVRACRRALGVTSHKEGTLRLRVLYTQTPAFRRGVARALAESGSPERRAIMREVRLGWKMSASTRRKISAALKGKPKSAEHCRKNGLAAKRRGQMPPWVVRPWTSEENALVKQLSSKEVAARTGRTVKAVYHQRKLLGLTKSRVTD